jgi:molybdenum cofactor cytidylyltransferase
MRDDPEGRVAGVLLAAGLSSRMGANKLLLPLGGQSVLRRAAITALAAGLDPLIVVLGHESDRAHQELAGLSCTALRNDDYASGIHSSLRAGFRAVPDDADAAVVVLADMPFVDAAMIRALIERFRAARAPLAISTYGGVIAPPTLYGRALFDELRALEGAGCGKRVIQRHRADAAELAWPESALSDLDVPADVERVRAALERA